MIEFLGGLVMWELGLIFIAMVAWGFSLWNETSVGFLVVLIVLLSISWTGAGSAWAAISLAELIWQITVYLVLGLAWSVWKWRAEAKKIKDYYRDYNKNHGGEYTKEYVIDRINDNKNYDTIGFWVIVWPLSSIGYFINDFIIDTINSIIRRMYNVYDRITASVMKDF